MSICGEIESYTLEAQRISKLLTDTRLSGSERVKLMDELRYVLENLDALHQIANKTNV